MGILIKPKSTKLKALSAEIKILKKHGFEIRFKNKMILRNIFEYVFVNKNLVD